MFQESDAILSDIIVYLKSRYSVHTIIMYGSRARNEATHTSDYDIVAICPHGNVERVCKLFKGFYLDAFIYPEEAVKNLDSYMVRIKDGIVLCQQDHVGDSLLNRVKKLFAEGPQKTPAWEKNEIMTWITKMFQRAMVKDIEGNFRLHWLLYDLLECYFKLRDLWYLGPKESFQWLKLNDLPTYQAFDKALQPGSEMTSIDDLVKLVAVTKT